MAQMLAGDQAKLRLAYSLLFGLPGTPMVYYGEEIGMGEDLALPEELVARAHDAAEREGQSPQSFVRAAVGDFSRNAHPDEWTQLMTRLRECDDPGAVCLETMIERRLAHLAAPETAR